MMIFLATFLAASSSVTDSIPEGEAVPDWALRMYGTDMQFEVMRNGQKIGTHTVTFKKEGDTFTAQTETQLKVKFLFFTAYRFQYTATEVWQNGTLQNVEAVTNDDGQISDYKVSFLGEEVTIEGDEVYRFYTDEVPIYPTNHWHPDVLSRSSVINTISGKINEVQITARDWDLIPVGDANTSALRHTYSGDLHSVDAWYDEQGRWVGLRFKGSDGSDIIYECIKCGAT